MTKTISMLLAAAAAAATTVAAAPASATVTFNLSSVTLATTAGGSSLVGTLTGSFTANDALNSILSFNITASAAGAFSGFTYTNANSSVTASVLPSQYFQLDSTTGGNELRLYFTSGLTSAGGTINPVFSYESERSGGNRFPAGAVVVAATPAVPEPATWGMMLVGFGVAGVALRRRHKVSAVRFA